MAIIDKLLCIAVTVACTCSVSGQVRDAPRGILIAAPTPSPAQALSAPTLAGPATVVSQGDYDAVPLGDLYYFRGRLLRKETSDPSPLAEKARLGQASPGDLSPADKAAANSVGTVILVIFFALLISVIVVPVIYRRLLQPPTTNSYVEEGLKKSNRVRDKHAPTGRTKIFPRLKSTWNVLPTPLKAGVIILAVVLASLGFSQAKHSYEWFFVDRPVNYQQAKRQLEIHHKGVYLGKQDKVQFYLWGPEAEKDFDDWRIWGEMKIPDSDFGASLKLMARAALLHGCSRVVLLPTKSKALAVNSESEDMLILDAKDELAVPPSAR
jgi:hypothetical protein